MAHFRISDDIEDHPQFTALSDRAFRVWVYAEAWCQRHLTDGAIPSRMALELRRSNAKMLTELVEAGLMIKDGATFRLAGFLKHNDSREVVTKRRQDKAARMERWRARKFGVTQGESILSETCQETRHETQPEDAPRDVSLTSPHLTSVQERTRSGGSTGIDLPSFQKLHSSRAALPPPLHARRNLRFVHEGRVGVWDWQHVEFKQRLGGDTPENNDRLHAFYAKVENRWETEGYKPTGLPKDEWLREFQREFGQAEAHPVDAFKALLRT
jgi:hypothetical protein